ELDIPDTAHLHADNPATDVDSNQVVITVNDGHALEATSVGSTAVTASLTTQQLQLAMAQAINEGRATGLDPQQPRNLANVAVYVDNLPRAELGFTSGGSIWIDRTAAGWGWSVNGALGGMDLTTVLAHELGHVLGFEHSDAGAMEATLAPGVQRVPEV